MKHLPFRDLHEAPDLTGPRQTEAELSALVEALPMPPTWTALNDAELMEGLFLGLSLEAIADRIDQRDGNVRTRFFALKRAAVGEGAFLLSDQKRLLAVVRARAVTA